ACCGKHTGLRPFPYLRARSAFSVGQWGFKLLRSGKVETAYCFKGLRIRTGVGSVQRSREKGRRENVRSRASQYRSPELRARTARFLSVSAPRPRAENVRQGRNGGGRGLIL